jgi:hypothetical protein
MYRIISILEVVTAECRLVVTSVPEGYTVSIFGIVKGGISRSLRNAYQTTRLHISGNRS